MHKTFSWREKTLTIIDNNAHMYQFEKEVFELTDYGNITIVLTSWGGGEEELYYENVFAVANGEIVWRIESFLTMYPQYTNSVFVGIQDYGDGMFLAIDSTGRRFLYNVQTGKIIRYLDWVK